MFGGNTLRLCGVECDAVIRALPDQAGLTVFGGGTAEQPARFGSADPMSLVPQTPWRLNPSQLLSNVSPPSARGISLGEPWNAGKSSAARGTALHLAMRTCLARSDLVPALAVATGLDRETLTQVAERARSLKDWLNAQGYSELLCEKQVTGLTKEGAEIAGTVDLIACGPSGCLLIDHKTGGPGNVLGPYWPQLYAYGNLMSKLMPGKPLRGAVTSSEPLFGISDTGTGIMPEVRDRLWEPYFTTKGNMGTGLGLPVIAEIVRETGGAIALETTPGVGTSFYVAWPVNEPVPEEAKYG